MAQAERYPASSLTVLIEDNVSDATAEEPSEPSDLPPEKVRDLLERLEDGARKVGLYFMHEGGLVVDDTPDEELEPGEERHHRLLMQFVVGDIAFSDRVQDPEIDKINDTLRSMERGDTQEQLRAILERYPHMRPKDR